MLSRDDVLRMAQQAADEMPDTVIVPHEFSIRLAALVAAAERELAAQKLDFIADGFERDSRRIASVTARGCAAAIRARKG